VAGTIVSFVLTPVIRRIAIRYGAIDQPEERRVNLRPVPRGGGVAVAASFILVTLVLLALNTTMKFVVVPPTVQLNDLVGLLVGGALATAFGVLDDALDLRGRWRFAGQFGLAIFAIACGFVIDFISNPVGRDFIRF